MNIANRNRLVILAGPSCVGKRPLAHALARFHPALTTFAALLEGTPAETKRWETSLIE